MKQLCALLLISLLCSACEGPGSNDKKERESQHNEPKTPPHNKLKVWPVPGVGYAMESYFSPDSRSLICYAKLAADDSLFHCYTVSTDGKDTTRINDKGEDACSFYFPNRQRIVFTSTRDHPELPKGDWSKEKDYPRGAELYTCDLQGKDLRRLTDNVYYDAEVSVSPDGNWILFTRQIDGNLDLWKMKADGTHESRITNTPEWQEGGAFYMPDSRTILYRAWRTEGDKPDKPMTIFTIWDDGTHKEQITHDSLVNWAPYPTPDGKHFVFAKMLPPHNYEIFLMNLETGEQKQLTYNDAFDGFPSVSPDGQTLSFSSSRSGKGFNLFLMDLSALQLGPAE